jgi:hypothetical protein
VAFFGSLVRGLSSRILQGTGGILLVLLVLYRILIIRLIFLPWCLVFYLNACWFRLQMLYCVHGVDEYRARSSVKSRPNPGRQSGTEDGYLYTGAQGV